MWGNTCTIADLSHGDGEGRPPDWLPGGSDHYEFLFGPGRARRFLECCNVVTGHAILCRDKEAVEPGIEELKALPDTR